MTVQIVVSDDAVTPFVARRATAEETAATYPNAAQVDYPSAFFGTEDVAAALDALTTLSVDTSNSNATKHGSTVTVSSFTPAAVGSTNTIVLEDAFSFPRGVHLTIFNGTLTPYIAQVESVTDNTVVARVKQTPNTAGIAGGSTVSFGDGGAGGLTQADADVRYWNATGDTTPTGAYLITDGSLSIPFSAAATRSEQFGEAATAANAAATAIGNSANASGANSVALGVDSTATVSGAIAVGSGAVAAGTNSIALGGSATTSGATSVVVGFSADTGGANNVVIGANAGNSGTTAGNLVVIGVGANTSAFTGAGNLTAVGVGASAVTTSGESCSFGRGALAAAVTPLNHAAFGTRALNKHTGGNTKATAFGHVALANSVTGQFVTAFGAGAATLSTGNNISAFGGDALVAATTGGNITALGNSAGSSVSTGASLFLVGQAAGVANPGTAHTTATNSFCVGNTSGFPVGIAQLTTQHACIGNNSRVGENGVFAINSSGASGSLDVHRYAFGGVFCAPTVRYMWLTTPVTFVAATSSLATTAGNTTVTGTNTTFLTTLAVGSEIRVGLTSEIRRVTAIASDTSLTVNEAMSVATSNSGWTYQNPAFSILNAGTMLLGGRSQTANTTTAVAQVQGALSVEDGHRIQEGANKWMGVATLSGSTVTVSNTRVTANSRIFLTTQSPSGTVGTPYISARTAGTSFTITSTGAADTSTVAWEIKEPF